MTEADLFIGLLQWRRECVGMVPGRGVPRRLDELLELYRKPRRPDESLDLDALREELQNAARRLGALRSEFFRRQREADGKRNAEFVRRLHAFVNEETKP